MTSQEERAREVLEEHCGSIHGFDESAAIAAMLALAAEVREDAAKVAEEDNTPGYGPHRNDMEGLASIQRANIAAAIRAQGGVRG